MHRCVGVRLHRLFCLFIPTTFSFCPSVSFQLIFLIAVLFLPFPSLTSLHFLSLSLFFLLHPRVHALVFIPSTVVLIYPRLCTLLLFFSLSLLYVRDVSSTSTRLRMRFWYSWHCVVSLPAFFYFSFIVFFFLNHLVPPPPSMPSLYLSFCMCCFTFSQW